MREVHPDVSNDDEDTTEFAVFLNDVYETLSDPERRAAYDEISGLAASGTNPFRDASYEADKVCMLVSVGPIHCSSYLSLVPPACFHCITKYRRAGVCRRVHLHRLQKLLMRRQQDICH